MIWQANNAAGLPRGLGQQIVKIFNTSTGNEGASYNFNMTVNGAIATMAQAGVLVGSGTKNQGFQILGTQTNDNVPTAGYVGEVIVASVPPGTIGLSSGATVMDTPWTLRANGCVAAREALRVPMKD